MMSRKNSDIKIMINVVADGHLDLRRELKKALSLQDDKERMELQILKLNIDMRDVKLAVGVA